MRIIALQLLYAIAWAGGTVLPQKASSPPDIEVVSAKWTMFVVRPNASSAPAISSETIERSDKVNDPMPVVVPNPKISEKRRELTYYVYSAELVNRGPKDIKALAWDYVFSDPVTHNELKRQLGFGGGLHANQKKTVEIRTPSSPPRVINATAVGAQTAFEAYVVIQCVLFADGSQWQSAEAKHESCELLRTLKPSRTGVRPR